jgi:hypothetical protein
MSSRPKCGGSKFARNKSKPRKRMEVLAILYANYFTYDTSYTAKGFSLMI